MSGLFFISIRRLRAPLVFIIVVFAVSTAGLALIPGVDAEGDPWRPTLFEAFYFVTYTATTIGFTAIVVLGRPGEIVRPYLISVREKVSFSSQLAAWFLERVFDTLLILSIFGVALVLYTGDTRHAGAGLTWVLRTGGSIAWAIRKGSPQLKTALGGFVKTHGDNTVFGRVTLQRYLQSTKYVKTATGEAEMRKFRAVVEIFRKYGRQYGMDWMLMAGFLEGKWRLVILLVLMIAATIFVFKFKERLAILGEFVLFLKERKLWWMTPIIIVFLLLSVLIIATEKSAILAFTYAIF